MRTWRACSVSRPRSDPPDDWAKRLTAVDLPAGFSSAVPTFAWRLDGLIAARSWSGTAASFGYDAAKRPTSITKGSLSLGQAYDRDGNVTTESRSFPSVSGDAGSGSQTFSYDALNRVTGSAGLAQTRSYTYDRDGNRRTRTVGTDTWTYVHDRTDQLVAVQKNALASQAFGYDAYGNLTSDAETGISVTAMTYDLADRLKTIDASGSTNDTTFTLDALGRFKTRAVNGVSDTYSYVGASEAVARIATAGGTTLDSIVSPAGDRLAVKAGTTLNYLVPDLHGNVAGSLDASEATVVNAVRYDAWGETIGTGSAGGSAAVAGAWKYQGRLDVSPAGLSTPLYDMSARFYAPGIAAFTSLDSVMGAAQDPLSMNRFLYAEANPATLIDPTGHAAVWGGGSSSKTLAEARATKATWQPSTIRYRKSKACAYDERCATNRGRRSTSGRVRTAGVDTPAQVRKQKLLGVLRTQAIRQQRAHDNDIGGAITDALWNNTIGFGIAGFQSAQFIAAHGDLIDDAAWKTAGNAFDAALFMPRTQIEIATHLDQVPGRTRGLMTELGGTAGGAINSAQHASAYDWTYAITTGAVVVAGTKGGRGRARRWGSGSREDGKPGLLVGW